MAQVRERTSSITVMLLKRPDDYKSKDGAIFQIHFEKARGFLGADAESFQAQLTTNELGLHAWTTSLVEDSSYNQIIKLTNEGYKQKDIAEKMNLHKSNVSRHVKRGSQEGRIVN